MKRLAALLLGTLAGVLLAEGVVRLLSDRLLGLSNPTVRFDPDLGWVQRAGDAGVRRNEAGQEVVIVGSPLGIRRPARPYETEGRETVLVLGDSFTAGTQVRFEDTWSAQLETRLRRNHPRVQVVNAGVDRYDLSQIDRLARRLVRVFRPTHLVVAVYLGNDVADYDRHAQVTEGWIARRSYLYHFIRGALSKVRGVPPHADEGAASSVVEGWSPQSVSGFSGLRPDEQARIRGQFAAADLLPAWRGSEDGLRRLASTARRLQSLGALARAEDAALTVVLLPMKQEIIPEQRAELRRLHGLSEPDLERPGRALVSSVGEGLRLVDLTATLRAHARPAELYWRIDSHMTPLGHAALAEALYPVIEERWGEP